MSPPTAFRVVIRFRTSRDPLGPFVTGSVVLHGFLIAAAFSLPLLHHRPRLPENPLVVELAGPLPGPRAPLASALPPTPPAPAPPKAPRVLPRAKEEKKERKQRDEPKKKETRPEPADSKAPPPVPAVSPASPPGDGPQGGGRPGEATGGITSMDVVDPQLAWWKASLTAALGSHWVKPVLEGAEAVYSVTISFDVLRDGTVRNFRIDSPSGIPSLDRSVERAVVDSVPLPTLPANWREPVFTARYRFDLRPGDF